MTKSMIKTTFVDSVLVKYIVIINIFHVNEISRAPSLRQSREEEPFDVAIIDQVSQLKIIYCVFLFVRFPWILLKQNFSIFSFSRQVFGESYKFPVEKERNETNHLVFFFFIWARAHAINCTWNTTLRDQSGCDEKKVLTELHLLCETFRVLCTIRLFACLGKYDEKSSCHVTRIKNSNN